MTARTSMAIAALAAAAVSFAPFAAAAPEQPAPVPVPPPAPPAAPTGLFPAIGSVLAQSDGAPTGPLGLPDLAGLGPALVLGQNAVPAAPGEPGGPVSIPNLNAFNPDALVPLNLDPAAPGEGQPAPGIGPSPEDPGTGRIAFLRRLHEMYEAGLLRGALLGQAEPGEIPTAPPVPVATATPSP